MFRKLIQTEDDAALLIARLALAIVIVPHGAQKLLGWFDGPGFGKALEGFNALFGVPAFLAVLVILAESFGAVSLLAGFLSRLQAFGIGLVMLGAVFMVHLQNGFFMNWTGQAAGEGIEYHILALGLATVILLKGGGKWSVDRVLVKAAECRANSFCGRAPQATRA